MGKRAGDGGERVQSGEICPERRTYPGTAAGVDELNTFKYLLFPHELEDGVSDNFYRSELFLFVRQ